MGLQQIPFEAQTTLILGYKGHTLKQTFKPDLICYEKIVIELKAVKELTDDHRSQVFNYLKATGFRLGLLVNFGHYPRLEIRADRVVKTTGN